MPARKRSYSKSLASLLGAANNGLQPLFVQARKMQTLNQMLRGALGEPLGPHVSLSNIRGDTAIIAADSPAWLTQLRYLAPTVLHILQTQEGFESLRKVQFKIRPASEPQAVELPPRRASLSATGADTLINAAEWISDPELADALRRLARNRST